MQSTKSSKSSKQKSTDNLQQTTKSADETSRASRAAAKSKSSKRGLKKETPKSKNDIIRAKWVASRGGYDPVVRWDTQPGSKIKPGQKRLSLLDAHQANNVLIEMGVDPSGLKGWEAKLAAIQDKLLADRSHYDVVVDPDLSDESDDDKDSEDEYNAFINAEADDEEKEDDEDREAEEEYNAFLNNRNDEDDNDDEDNEKKEEDDDDFGDTPSEEEEDSDYMYAPGNANRKAVKRHMEDGDQILKRGRGRPAGSTDLMPMSARGMKKPARERLRDRWVASMGGYDPILRWGSREGSTMRPGKRRLSLLDACQANAVLFELGEDPKQYSGWQPKCEAIHKILVANRDHPIIMNPILDSDSD